MAHATPKRRRGRPPATTTSNEVRTSILTAAIKVFAKDGFDGASIFEIARHADVGGPLVHYHFGSKENLWRETVDFALRELAGPIATIANSARYLEPIDALKLLCRALADYSAKWPEHVLILINEVRFPGERLDYVLKKYLSDIHHVIDKQVERAIQKGLLKKIPIPYVTTSIIYSITLFYASAPLVENLYKINPSDADVSEQHIESVIEIIFKGLECEI